MTIHSRAERGIVEGATLGSAIRLPLLMNRTRETFDDALGRTVTLRLARFATPGAYLAIREGDDEDVVLLPGAEVPKGLLVGAMVPVFIYRDSEDRFVATTATPMLELGEVRFLEVKEVGRVGAFFDWGLMKDLLVPFAEQTRDLQVGTRQPIGLYVDSSGRLAGTMRVTEMLEGAPNGLNEGQWLEGESWRNDPEIGLFAIVLRKHVGLVPCVEPHGLKRGEATRFRVTQILDDGKFELSLRAPAHEQLEGDADIIIRAMRRDPEARYSDDMSPDEVRDAFRLSKKAFKRAMGRLFKGGDVVRNDDGSFALSKKHT